MTLMKPQKNSGLATVDVTSTKDQHNEDSRTVETTTEDRQINNVCCIKMEHEG